MMDAFIRWPILLDEYEAAWDAEIAAGARRDLIETARRVLGRLSQHEQWDCSARAYAEEAADILRQLGLPELAEMCEQPWGCDAAAVIAKLEWS